jgi:hypothetical protein
LGEFSHIGWLFTLGSFFNSPSYLLIFTKHGLGYIFTNSSGHPGGIADPLHTFKFLVPARLFVNRLYDARIPSFFPKKLCDGESHQEVEV